MKRKQSGAKLLHRESTLPGFSSTDVSSGNFSADWEIFLEKGCFPFWKEATGVEPPTP